MKVSSALWARPCIEDMVNPNIAYVDTIKKYVMFCPKCGRHCEGDSEHEVNLTWIEMNSPAKKKVDPSYPRGTYVTKEQREKYGCFYCSDYKKTLLPYRCPFPKCPYAEELGEDGYEEWYQGKFFDIDTIDRAFYKIFGEFLESPSLRKKEKKNDK